MRVQPAPSTPSAPPAACPVDGGLPPPVAADLHGHLAAASHDMERLQRLLGDACEALLGSFYGATAELKTLLHRGATHSGIDAPELHAAMQHLAAAITALQFQDMASQLVDHTTRRLRHCAHRVAADTLGDDEDGKTFVEPAPLRPNPVTQDEMDAGSVELF